MMAAETLQRRGSGSAAVVLDPRSKLLFILIISVFVLGGAGNGIMVVVRPILCAVPLVLLLFSRKFAAASLYSAVYLICYIIRLLWSPEMSGLSGFLVLFITDLFCRFLPSFAMGYYVISSTTVSEFTAAMKRMHVTDKIIIPFSVRFRFFPTVAEEAKAINNAMRMRGIRFGGKKASKILEYRLVPMLVCSVKIGEELSAAALVRGLGAPVERTNICKIGFHAQDVLIWVMCGGAIFAYALNLLGIA